MKYVELKQISEVKKTIGYKKTSFSKFENSVSKQEGMTEYIKRTLYPEGNIFSSDYL